MPVRAALALLALAAFGCATARQDSANLTKIRALPCEATDPDDLIGTWREAAHGFVMQVARQGNAFTMTSLVDAKGPLPEPQIDGEFRQRAERPCEFVGRHIWGGQRYSTTKWGEDGGLEVRQLSSDTLFVRYLDSRYTGGWTYQRERHPFDRGACEGISPDDLLGRWKNPGYGFIIEIGRFGDRYVELGIADRQGPLPMPEVSGEFRPDPNTPCEFSGRHKWGDARQNQQARWGDEGGLRIRQLGKDEILVQYLDSRYTGGWNYVRDRDGR